MSSAKHKFHPKVDFGHDSQWSQDRRQSTLELLKTKDNFTRYVLQEARELMLKIIRHSPPAILMAAWHADVFKQGQDGKRLLAPPLWSRLGDDDRQWLANRTAAGLEAADMKIGPAFNGTADSDIAIRFMEVCMSMPLAAAAVFGPCVYADDQAMKELSEKVKGMHEGDYDSSDLMGMLEAARNNVQRCIVASIMIAPKQCVDYYSTVEGEDRDDNSGGLIKPSMTDWVPLCAPRSITSADYRRMQTSFIFGPALGLPTTLLMASVN